MLNYWRVYPFEKIISEQVDWQKLLYNQNERNKITMGQNLEITKSSPVLLNLRNNIGDNLSVIQGVDYGATKTTSGQIEFPNILFTERFQYRSLIGKEDIVELGMAFHLDVGMFSSH